MKPGFAWSGKHPRPMQHRVFDHEKISLAWGLFDYTGPRLLVLSGETMSDVIEGKGSCLCGAVQFVANRAQTSMGICHCGMCRKWGGGPYMSVRCETDVMYEGQENISDYSSSEWANRGFCKICGSHLYFRLKQNGHYFVPAGLFDDQEHFSLDRQVYIDNKPDFYSFSNDTQNITEAEILEILGKSN